LVFILVDTTRADFLSSYGFDERVTPHLDEFADSSIVFENVTSQSNCTFPSVNSLFTSRYPWPFLDREDPDFLGIPKSTPSFAEILQQQGYRTAAISASPIVRSRPGSLPRAGGFERGFDDFDDRCEWKNARCIVDTAIARLDQHRRPIALYLHFIDPHDPYSPPPDFEKRFAGEYEGLAYVEEGDPRPIERQVYKVDKDDTHRPKRYEFVGRPDGIESADIEHLENLYADEIAYFDSQLGRLFEYLRQRGLFDRSLIVVASDHGEDFLEHGHIRHCRSLFRTQTWTPLLVRFPTGGPHGRRQALVQNIDIVPTIFDYLDVQSGEVGFEGQSLRGVIEADGLGNPYAFSAMGALRAVRNERFRLIVERSDRPDEPDRSIQLFDLESDPGEEYDLLEEHPEVAAELSQVLDVWEAQTRGAMQNRTANSELEDRLRALGYLE
jgi:arylsulfatase A-like enzyme